MSESFDISYSDLPNLIFYAILFSCEDSSKAWNPLNSDFEMYTLESHSSFVLLLEEDENRIGWYTYSIDEIEKLPAVSDNQSYFIEVWQKKTANFDRTLDLNTGYLDVFWNKEQNDWLEIAERVWTYGTRELTDFSGITPQQIWEYSTRTLTSGGTVECDFTELEKHILAAIVLSTGKTLEELSKVNSELGSSIDKTFELLKTCCSSRTKGTPTIQSPRIGPRGSSSQGSDMRFG